MYKFIKSDFEQNENYFNQYMKKLSYNIDSFQEEHLLDSKVYSILVDGVHHGCFAFSEKVFGIEGFKVLTLFVLEPKILKHSQPIFEKILEEYDIKSAFVSSADEQLLSIAMDFHKSVNLQAFMHVDGEFPVRAPEFPRSCLYEASEEDFVEIQRLTNNYFDFLLEPRKKGNYQLYMLKSEGVILGFGLLEYGEIIKEAYSLGNYTIEEHRTKGVGRSIMLHLKDICYEKGIKPLTGCYWYNTKSKATLDSAGFISQTRLFRVEFTEDEKWTSI